MISHADTYERLYQEAGGLEGSTWYFDARSTARKFARAHGITLGQAAGVIAAMSPGSLWKSNVTVANRIIAAFVADRTAPCPTSGFGFTRNVSKAWRILQGERPRQVFSTSPKVGAFYRSIMGDQSQAVVDMWMMRAAGFDHDSPTKAEYLLLAAALAEAALRQGVPTNVLQAVVWTHVRGGSR